MGREIWNYWYRKLFLQVRRESFWSEEATSTPSRLYENNLDPVNQEESNQKHLTAHTQIESRDLYSSLCKLLRDTHQLSWINYSPCLQRETEVSKS